MDLWSLANNTNKSNSNKVPIWTLTQKVGTESKKKIYSWGPTQKVGIESKKTSMIPIWVSRKKETLNSPLQHLIPHVVREAPTFFLLFFSTHALAKLLHTSRGGARVRTLGKGGGSLRRCCRWSTWLVDRQVISFGQLRGECKWRRERGVAV